jgi:outer membrane protein assembly factor BamB
MLLIG